MSRLAFANGIRGLLRRPRSVLPAILVLGIGLGAATAVFTLVDAALLRPLPFPQSERIVGFWSPGSWATGELDFLRWEAESYEAVGAFAAYEMAYQAAEPRVLQVAVTSADVFEVLGVSAMMGRTFLPQEERPGQDQVALVSERFWRTELGADPSSVGKTLRLDGDPYEVVGILSGDFAFPAEDTELWLPLTVDRASGDYRRSFYLSMIGKLKAGVSVRQAQEEVRTLVPALQEALDLQPGFDKLAEPAAVMPLRDQISRRARAPLLALFAASGLLLLIACVNVAHLLLAQALRRRRELAIRGALGASRGTLVMQLMGEAFGIALCGGGLGLLAAFWSVDVLSRRLPQGTPGLAEMSIDTRIFAFGALATLLTVVLFGVLPALRASRTDFRQALVSGSAGSGTGRRRSRLRWGLVSLEMALAAMLAVAAVSTFRSFLNLAGESPGFDRQGIVTLRPELSGDTWEEREKMLGFYSQALDALESAPEIRSAGAIWRLPLAQGGGYQKLAVEGHEPAPGEVDSVYWRAIEGDYFGTMGIPLLAGRSFESQEVASGRQVAVINKTLAEAFWPDGNAVGSRLRSSFERDWVTIVGVVGDVRHEDLRRDAAFTLYRPLAQSPSWITRMALVARAEGSSSAALAAMHQAVARVAPTVPVHRAMAFEEVLTEAVSRERLTGNVIGLYGCLSLLLASVGVFGLLSFTVSQQRRDIGIRMALGAERGTILRQVTREGMTPALLGAFVGILLALALGRFAGAFLYGVGPADPLTLLAVVSTLLIVAMGACWLPARRAAGIEPVRALKEEG